MKIGILDQKQLSVSHLLDGGRNHTCLWCLKKQGCISDHKFLINHLWILFQFLTSHWWMIINLLTLVWTWIFFVGGPQGDLLGRVSVGLGIIPFWGFGAVSKNTQLPLTSAGAEEYLLKAITILLRKNCWSDLRSCNPTEGDTVVVMSQPSTRQPANPPIVMSLFLDDWMTGCSVRSPSVPLTEDWLPTTFTMCINCLGGQGGSWRTTNHWAWKLVMTNG